MPETTIKDIAKKCGVGVSTVSRAINDHPDINPETKRKIMEVIRENGFVPNNSARNLKRTDAKTIAVLVKGMANPLFTDMIKVIEEETHRKKYSLELKHVEYYEDEVDVALELVKEKRLKGIIFLGGYFFHAEEKIANLAVPCIFSTIGANVSERLDRTEYSSVSVDDRKESRAMTSYLIGLGHREIAIISAESEVESIGRLRLEGYRDALLENGISCSPGLIRRVEEGIDHFSLENGYRTMKKLIESGEKFTAVFATADLLAIGACRALLEAGFRIPEDVSVAGFDGIELGKYYNPAITTMKQPVKEMAETTIRLLFDIIAGKAEYGHIVFPAALEARESSGVLQCK